VLASCVIVFDKLYRTVEVHSVCVASASRGQGACGRLMQEVIAHIELRRHDRVREIRVFCESGNPAACKCYAKHFPDYVSNMVAGRRAFGKRVGPK
jgi:predicted GNAT superfamily acetyltransferase